MPKPHTTHTPILKDLKAKKYAPIYFLQAEEPYFIDVIVQHIEKEVLDEGEKSFNQVVLYGKETNFKQVMDQAMQFPMMAPKRVVIVKEAQEMRDLDKMEAYFKQPAEQTLLVIAHKHKKLDKRKKAWKALGDNAIILDGKRIYDNKVPGLIQDMARDHGLGMDAKVAHLMAENLGNNLSKIANELIKLKLNLPAEASVSIQDIETYVGISKDYNIFELQKAIGLRDKNKAYRITQYFSSNKKSHPIQMNIGALYNYFSRLLITKKYERSGPKTVASKLGINPYVVGDYISAARNYSLAEISGAFHHIHIMDRKSKGVDARRSDDLGLYRDFLHAVFNGTN